MVERRQPPVSELALADALERLVVMINELRIDVGLCVEATVDDASLVKLTFSGTPDTGFPLQREVKDFPGAGGPPCLERGTARLRSRLAPRSRRRRSGHSRKPRNMPE